MAEFRPSKDPKFPFELAPKQWDRRVYLFTLKQVQAYQAFSPEQREIVLVAKKARREYRMRNTMAFQDKSR